MTSGASCECTCSWRPSPNRSRSRGLGNPITDNDLVGAIAPNLTVDQGLSPIDLLNLGLDFRNANFGAAPELTLPTVTYGETYYYDGGNYGDVIFPDAPADQKVIDEFLGIDPARGAPRALLDQRVGRRRHRLAGLRPPPSRPLSQRSATA